MPQEADPHLWKTAWLYMMMLGTLFFVGYPITNLWASQHTAALSMIRFDQYIPFWSWMLYPYLSVNLLYPCSFFLHQNVETLKRFSKQLLIAQTGCLLIFFFYPTINLHPSTTAGGLTGLLLKQLKQFDRPFNMLPSLHIAVLVVLWHHPIYKRLTLAGKIIWHASAMLIVLSTLFSWQHYILDVVAGLMLGVFSIVLAPYQSSLHGNLPDRQLETD